MMQEILRGQGVSDEDCEIPSEEEFSSLVKKFGLLYNLSIG